MSYGWLGGYLLQKAGVTTDYQPEWQATRYFVGGKMFAMQGGDRNKRPIFTMKLEPSLGDFLRRDVYKRQLLGPGLVFGPPCPRFSLPFAIKS